MDFKHISRVKRVVEPIIHRVMRSVHTLPVRYLHHWICFVCTGCLMILLLIGCLYSYHDFKFMPNPAQANGYWIDIEARLFHQTNKSDVPVDGKVTDSANSFWDLEWYGNVDDSLRSIAHLESDSVSIWPTIHKDTLHCDVRQDMTGGHWKAWTCGKLMLQQLDSQDITLRMIIFMIFNDGREPRRFEVIWSGKQKTTKIHSDY